MLYFFETSTKATSKAPAWLSTELAVQGYRRENPKSHQTTDVVELMSAAVPVISVLCCVAATKLPSLLVSAFFTAVTHSYRDETSSSYRTVEERSVGYGK